MQSRNEYTTTILFDPPFWIALFEYSEENTYSVAREVIGTSEPSQADIFLFFERLSYKNLHFTKPVDEVSYNPYKISFKKMQKRIRKSVEENSYRYVYSKAHEELKKQQEKNSVEKKVISKKDREEKNRYKYGLKQEKKKQKHRGH